MSASERKQGKKGGADFREMTAAHVREPKGAEFVEVMFLESARIYKVFKKNPKSEDILGRLREAARAQRPVRVQLNLPHGDVIEDVASGP